MRKVPQDHKHKGLPEANEGGNLKQAGYLRTPEVWVLAAGLAALVLVWVLRGSPSLSLPRFLATLTLFMVPGSVLSFYALGSSLRLTHVPVAFTLSTGLFGLLGVPMLVLHRSLAEYLWACGGVLILSMFLALLKVVRSGAPTEIPSGDEPGVGLLWIPFTMLTVVLASLSTRTFHAPGADVWTYLSYVQDYLGKDALGQYDAVTDGAAFGGLSRLSINGWLLEQAAFARLSDIDAATLVLDYLAPTLVVVSLLAFYGLARLLLDSTPAGFFATTLYALFLLIYLNSSPASAGGEFVARITEDKFAARFVFLPVALAFAGLFLKERKLRFLALFALVYCSTVAVHPLVVVNVSTAVFGFGVVHLVSNLRERGAWLRVGGLAVVLLGIALPPVAYLLVSGGTLPSLSDATNAASAGRLTSAVEQQQRLLALGDGSYVMHPALLLTPVMLGTLLVGTPFLLWRLRRSLAAQMLLGSISSTLVLLYTPPIATFAAYVVGPWHLWRLSWALPLAAVLTLGWIAWELLDRASVLLSRSTGTRRASPYLHLISVGLLLAVTAPYTIAGIRSADSSEEQAIDRSSCTDPVFAWMRERAPVSGEVLLTEEDDSVCIPAQIASSRLAVFRNPEDVEKPAGSEQGLEGVQTTGNSTNVEEFFDFEALDEGMIEVIRRYGTSYVLLPTSSPLDAQLPHLPGFVALDTPGERYRLYRVEQEKLAATPLIEANGYLNEGDWERAADAYVVALQTSDGGERLSALFGIGRAYRELGLFEDSVLAYEAAAELAPEDPVPHVLMTKTYAAANDPAGAVEASKKAVERRPEDAGMRLELGEALSELSEHREAAEQYDAVVRSHPKVPEYRLGLGRALMLAGEPEAGGEHLERAVSLDPLSTQMRTDVGQAYRQAGRLEEALPHHEWVRDMNPNNQGAALRLGMLYSRLSTTGARNEAYFKEAEDELSRIMELEPPRNGRDLRAKAQVALGDLYNEWDRSEQATEAYRKALQIDPNSPAAKRLRRPPS